MIRRLIPASLLVGLMSIVPLASGVVRTNEGYEVQLTRAVSSLPPGWSWVGR